MKFLCSFNSSVCVHLLSWIPLNKIFFNAVKCKFAHPVSIPYFILVGRKDYMESQQFKRGAKSCGKVEQPEPEVEGNPWVSRWKEVLHYWSGFTFECSIWCKYWIFSSSAWHLKRKIKGWLGTGKALTKIEEKALMEERKALCHFSVIWFCGMTWLQIIMWRIYI